MTHKHISRIRKPKITNSHILSWYLISQIPTLDNFVNLQRIDISEILKLLQIMKKLKNDWFYFKILIVLYNNTRIKWGRGFCDGKQKCFI